MKKFRICALVLLLSCTACSKKESETNIPKEKNPLDTLQMTCTREKDDFFHCDNDDSIYAFNEQGDFLGSDRENYQYVYNEDGLVSSIIKDNKLIFEITYGENKLPVSIQNNFNPKEIIYYSITYNENNLPLSISKFYGDEELDDKIFYEYYQIDGIDYGKEIRNAYGSTYARTFKVEHIKNRNNIFELVHFFPQMYISYLKYNPYSNFNQIYPYNDSPIYISAIEEYSANVLDMKSNIIDYYFDEKGQYITDSQNNIIHMFEDISENESIRYTIYFDTETNNGYSRIHYYQYKIHYFYEEDEIVKFEKYNEIEIKEEEYQVLKEKYLKK